MSATEVLYNTIGKDYNATRMADPYLVQRLFELLSVKMDGSYLDIGCGTGNYTVALGSKGLKFWGVEPSEEMLRIARLRECNVKWTTGTAEVLPVRDAEFDGAIATLTIHHWSDLGKAFAEIKRVLKPGAKLVIFTATPVQMRGYWLNHYFPAMMERSIVQMPSIEYLGACLHEAGFEIHITEKYFISADLKDHFLYCGKHDPELYFDPNIRKGISSFAALANLYEVEKGLTSLRSDIDQGNFAQIKARYTNNEGDYLFIVAQKSNATL